MLRERVADKFDPGQGQRLAGDKKKISSALFHRKRSGEPVHHLRIKYFFLYQK